MRHKEKLSHKNGSTGGANNGKDYKENAKSVRNNAVKNTPQKTFAITRGLLCLAAVG
jgi:hypothetical protein